MILRELPPYKRYSRKNPGGVTELCFWDAEEAAKEAIHYIVNNTDDLLRRWDNANNRKRNRERARYLYLHDPTFFRMRRLRAKRLNHTLRGYWEWLCVRLDYRCQICGKRFEFFDLEVDHIHPLSRGGENVWNNIQPLCADCNLRKLAKIIDPSSEVVEAQKEARSLGIIL
jgi:5-methylcytosine-specific restriction endonuclease McrA